METPAEFTIDMDEQKQKETFEDEQSKEIEAEESPGCLQKIIYVLDLKFWKWYHEVAMK